MLTSTPNFHRQVHVHTHWSTSCHRTTVTDIPIHHGSVPVWNILEMLFEQTPADFGSSHPITHLGLWHSTPTPNPLWLHAYNWWSDHVPRAHLFCLTLAGPGRGTCQKGHPTARGRSGVVEQFAERRDSGDTSEAFTEHSVELPNYQHSPVFSLPYWWYDTTLFATSWTFTHPLFIWTSRQLPNIVANTNSYCTYVLLRTILLMLLNKYILYIDFSVTRVVFHYALYIMWLIDCAVVYFPLPLPPRYAHFSVFPSFPR